MAFFTLLVDPVLFPGDLFSIGLLVASFTINITNVIPRRSLSKFTIGVTSVVCNFLGGPFPKWYVGLNSILFYQSLLHKYNIIEVGVRLILVIS